MDKAEFLRRVDSAHERWQELVEKVGAARLSEPESAGPWSTKDLMAHIAWYEREMVAVIRERSLAGSELWNLDNEARNAVIFRQNQDRSPDDVQTEAAVVHQQLREALEELPEEHYGNPARFRNMPADWLPWQVFAGNTYEHYLDHAADLEAWLAG